MHCPAKIAYERTAFTREVVDASFTRAVDVGIWRQESLWLAGRHRHVYEPIAEQPGTSDGEFASFRDLNVIVNLQRYIHALAFAHHSRTTRDFSDFRACEQNIGTFQQAAGVVEANGETIIRFEALAQSAELHDERT